MRNHYDGMLDEYHTEENKQYVKPSIGIMPHKIWIELRIQELSKALVRYATDANIDNKDCMIDWSKELADLLSGYFEEK